jgi:tetratricopeptide (TPR) repeat protein
MEKTVINLINELQRYDNPKGYNLDYTEVKDKLQLFIKELTSFGEETLEELYKLIKHEDRWSCLFALGILKEIKSEKSIPYIIELIVNNEKKELDKTSEEAMFALTNIGLLAIEPLLREVKNQFEKKMFYFYLTGALTEIKSEKVYDFMKEITEDYLKNEEKYDEWFYIDTFVADFDVQENKEILPLLNKLISLDRISKHERIEILDTIKKIKDPAGFQQELEEEIKEVKPLIEKYLKEEKGKFGNKINKEEFSKRMYEPDKELEIQFKCNDCNKKQNINPGIIKILGSKDNKFSFENEVLCRYCLSNNIKPTMQGGRDIMLQAIGTFAGYKTGIVSASDEVYVENKLMLFAKTYDYILERIKQSPKEGGLYLRAGNIARNFNKYYEAIKHYEKAIELNPKLIAAYINLIEVYEFRHKYYKIEDAKVSATFYLNEMINLFRSQNYDILTLKNAGDVIQFLGEKSESLEIYIPELIKILPPNKKKIGRNEPCPCGSGKKYKKCCLKL